MTHSLDNGEVYFPIEGRREDSREEKLGDTYPRRAYTIEGISVGPKREELVRPKRNRPVSVQTRATACLRLFSPIHGVSKRRGKSIHPGYINVDRSLLFLSPPYVNIERIFLLFSFSLFLRRFFDYRDKDRGVFFSSDVIKESERNNFFLSPVDIYSRKTGLGDIQAISI